MVDLLLTKRAAANSRDGNARTPLHYAAFGQRNETPLILISKGAEVDAKDKKAWTPLYLASLNNRPKMAELLINKGAKVNPAKSPSPLMGAVRDGHTQVVKVLLDYKAQVHGPPKASKTPLHLAAEKGYPQIAELLIEHKASPNRKDRTGNTPLYYATYNDHTQVMRMLIEAKGDVNQKIREGTLLHLAAQRGSGEASRLLLKHGAKLEVKNAKGHRPLDVAINNGNRGIADMITAEMIKRREVGK
jgi:ankyrin repeat protein